MHYGLEDTMTGSAVSTGYLFKGPAIIVFGVIALWASWSGLIGLTLLCGFLLASAGVARFWAYISLKSVSFNRSLGRHRVFPGENIQARIKISNRKLLPMFWLRIDEQIPAALVDDPHGADTLSFNGFPICSRTVSVPGYAAVFWERPLHCRRRGYYPLGRVSMTSGDMFGLYSSVQTVSTEDEIIVFPRIYELNSGIFPFHSPLGESKADQNIYHDPSRMVGLRDYNPQDSLRHVHWKASARKRQLQVKVFESTVTIKTAMFVSVESFSRTTEDSKRFEAALSTAASIFVKLIEQKNHAGLFINSRQEKSGLPVLLNPGNTHTHLMEALEMLAKCGKSPCGTFNDLLVGQVRHLPWGCVVVLILQNPSEEIRTLIYELGLAGRKVIVLDMGQRITGGHSSQIEDYYHVAIEDTSGMLNFDKVNA